MKKWAAFFLALLICLLPVSAVAASPCDNRQHTPRPHLCRLHRRLQVRGDDGTLTTVAPENFPAEDVEVLLSYPQGTNRSCTFVITYMITSGERAGQIETLKGTRTKGGILVRFTSMSPVCITYQVHTSTGADRTAAVGVSSPRTADSSRVALWSAACVCSAALLLSITVKKKKYA